MDNNTPITGGALPTRLNKGGGPRGFSGPEEADREPLDGLPWPSVLALNREDQTCPGPSESVWDYFVERTPWSVRSNRNPRILDGSASRVCGVFGTHHVLVRGGARASATGQHFRGQPKSH